MIRFEEVESRMRIAIWVFIVGLLCWPTTAGAQVKSVWVAAGGVL